MSRRCLRAIGPLRTMVHAGYLQASSIASCRDLNVADRPIATISKRAAQSWQMENRYKTMTDGKFDFGFAVDWMRKDLGICLSEAQRRASAGDGLVDQFYSNVQSMGGRRWDTSSLIARLER